MSTIVDLTNGGDPQIFLVAWRVGQDSPAPRSGSAQGAKDWDLFDSRDAALAYMDDWSTRCPLNTYWLLAVEAGANPSAPWPL